MTTQTTIEVTESVTEVSVTGTTTTINLTNDITELQAYTLAVPFEVPGQITAANVTVVPYGTVTSTNLRDALKELADQDFRGASTPTGSYISEGDTWYDTDDDQLKVYRETSSGTFQWVPIIVGAAGSDSDTIDAGSY
ncbi:MAG: hypothetical protein CMA04_000310 [Methanobacteriota archaeon]|nr:MAG: hypothetical protein CMA04_007645 [Euryarchaeota archaeon]RAH11186.1 MAG: hypothetical protein CMA04_000310 [Euryarchaeota archaeon]